MKQWLVVVSFGLTACQAHVSLKAPPPEAPLEDRVKAYEELQRLSSYELVSVRAGAVVSSAPSYLQLRNGARVYHPEDLLPVLAPTSVAAQAATESQAARGRFGTYLGVGGGIGAAGLIAVVALMASAPEVPGVGSPEFGTALKARGERVGLGVGVGIASVAVGLGVALIGNLIEGRPAADALRTAFETYDAGLRARLSLPAKGEVQMPLQLVPPPPPPPPPPTPEVLRPSVAAPVARR